MLSSSLCHSSGDYWEGLEKFTPYRHIYSRYYDEVKFDWSAFLLS